MTNENVQFDVEMLDGDAKARIEAISKNILGLGKKDTEATFELGALIDEASTVIGDDRLCDSWLVAHLGFTGRHARNIRAVHRNLAGLKAKCIRLAVSPTNLYKLAHAEPDGIEAVLRIYESGQRPQVREVSAILKGPGDTDDTDLPIEDRPTLTGLAKYGAQEQRSRITRMRELLSYIIAHIIEAYEPELRGRAVVKSHLREKIRLQSEEAHDLLRIMIGLLRRDDHWASAIGHLGLVDPENDGGCARLLKLLNQLQYIENVSSKTLPAFLKDSAIPQLQWSLGLKDKEIAALFEKAAEKNAPKTAKKAAKKAQAKNEPERAETPSEGPPSLEDKKTEKPKHKFERPDFLNKAAEKAA
ncbi:MAG: hypothetical protein K5905_24190 [Roseibium sp.]|uniref:hypothetical protein n=1 Tax=Roseibium sp. TaxID=1936156 RepID=UPI002616E295|nr:hypothetical protein [Roseibium sp.]MCV0428569.1 hypothetical protein [Roseibium sp.]